MNNLMLYIPTETNLPPEYIDGYCLFALISVSIPILIILGIIFSIWYMDTHEPPGKKKSKTLTILLLLCSICCTAQTRNVGNVALNNPELKKCIQEETKGVTDVKEITSVCSSITRRCLTFSTQSKLKDLQQLSFEKKTPTHCVGYAKVFTACCNYAFAINHIDAKCYHVRGPLKLAGIDFTKFMSSCFSMLGMTHWANFFKNHDYGMIKYKGKEWKVEPMI